MAGLHDVMNTIRIIKGNLNFMGPGYL